MSRIIALHGFFGHPRDFAPLGLPHYAPRIFYTETKSLSDWAARYNPYMPNNSVLMGYSMGGRLALHCLLDNPNKYRAAIIMAANPGLVQDRFERRIRDAQWAHKIQTKNWEFLLKEWDEQEVFGGVAGPLRHERDFHRQSLALCLKRFSLSSQDYLVPRINTLELPILWLCSQEELSQTADLKFAHPKSLVYPMTEGKHRFIFAEAQKVGKLIRNFILGRRYL
jgi:2-succinyl-6-hydroxy-2,4-cyclohexadiene-1-carboxylate synthase